LGGGVLAAATPKKRSALRRAAFGAGSKALAVLWESAWKESGAAKKLTNADFGPVDQPALKKLYLDTTFVPSKTLNQIGEILGQT
jgi:hypothetical protein